MNLAHPYTKFAQIYDETMRDVPYLQWAAFLHEKFKQEQLSAEAAIAELGCGTGPLITYLKPIYNKLLGIDISRPMLKRAWNKKCRRLIEADMLALPFAESSLQAAFCVHDSLNYLHSKQELLRHLNEVNRVIKPGGIYICDVTTEQNVKKNYDRQTFEEAHGNYEICWYNEYDAKAKEIVSTLELSFRDTSGRQQSWRELHRQRIFDPKELKKTFREANFHLIEVIGDYGKKPPRRKSQLAVYVLRKMY